MLASIIRNRDGNRISPHHQFESIARLLLPSLLPPSPVEASTAFQLLTPLQSVPIFAALQSVGEFSRVVSKARTRKCFAKSILILEDEWGKACVVRRR
jgi:hypothetical protein